MIARYTSHDTSVNNNTGNDVSLYYDIFGTASGSDLCYICPTKENYNYYYGGLGFHSEKEYNDYYSKQRSLETIFYLQESYKVEKSRPPKIMLGKPRVTHKGISTKQKQYHKRKQKWYRIRDGKCTI